MTSTMRRSIIGTLAGVALAAAALPVSAQQQEAWKVGSAAQPGSALMGILEGNIGNWNKAPNVKVERQFVASEQELAQQVLRGRLPMASIS